MKVTQCLAVEHQMFLQHLDRLAEALSSDTPVEVLQGMVAMLAGPLERHAEAEDAVLFPALEPHLGREMGPLAVMGLEHEEIRQSLLSVEDGGANAVVAVRQLIAVLREHIGKEDQVLFPMAERLLGDQRLEELAQVCPHHGALS